jgi:hypothetical protein
VNLPLRRIRPGVRRDFGLRKNPMRGICHGALAGAKRGAHPRSHITPDHDDRRRHNEQARDAAMVAEFDRALMLPNPEGI